VTGAVVVFDGVSGVHIPEWLSIGN